MPTMRAGGGWVQPHPAHSSVGGLDEGRGELPEMRAGAWCTSGGQPRATVTVLGGILCLSIWPASGSPGSRGSALLRVRTVSSTPPSHRPADGSHGTAGAWG